MAKVKEFFKEKKMLIIIMTVVLLCSVAIAVGIYAQITDASLVETESQEEITEKKYDELKNNFKNGNIFTNEVIGQKEGFTSEDLIYVAYEINEEKKGKYTIDAKIPYIKIDTEVTKEINNEILNIFGTKLVDILQNSTVYTIYNIDYVAYVNDNVLSIIISCTLKDGTNPQRAIIQTYNYDIDSDKKLTLNEIIDRKGLDKEKVQERIDEEIEKEIAKTEGITVEGYQVFTRNKDDEMYLIENTYNFFLGEEGYLYIVYAYGNTNYTRDIDLIIL